MIKDNNNLSVTAYILDQEE
jgi:hypothetical protein